MGSGSGSDVSDEGDGSDDSEPDIKHTESWGVGKASGDGNDRSPNESYGFGSVSGDGFVRSPNGSYGFDKVSLDYRRGVISGDLSNRGDDVRNRVSGERFADDSRAGDSRGGVLHSDKFCGSSSQRCSNIDRSGKNLSTHNKGNLYECISVFVGNLPSEFSVNRLKSMFSEFGVVCDIFVSQKLSKIDASKFAFVRFRHEVDAIRAIDKMDGAKFDGKTLVVNIARYSRNKPVMLSNLKVSAAPNFAVSKLPLVNKCLKPSSEPFLASGKDCFGKSSYAQIVSGESVGRLDASVKKVCTPFHDSEWLLCSVVASLRSNCKFADIDVQICNIFEEVLRVSYLRERSCLITFSSIDSRNEALKNKAWSQWFSSLEPWVDESSRGLGRIWISCIGIPLLVWNLESFSLIAKLWGNLIEVDSDTANRRNLASAKLLIETNVNVINEVIELSACGQAHKVAVSSVPWAERCCGTQVMKSGVFSEKCNSDVSCREGSNIGGFSLSRDVRLAGDARRDGSGALVSFGRNCDFDGDVAGEGSEMDGGEVVDCGAFVAMTGSDASDTKKEDDNSCSVPISSDLFGVNKDNIIKALDVDLGSLVHSDIEALPYQCVLNELELKGGMQDEVRCAVDSRSKSDITNTMLSQKDDSCKEAESSSNHGKHAVVVNGEVFELEMVQNSVADCPSSSVLESNGMNDCVSSEVLNCTRHASPVSSVCESFTPDCVQPGSEFARVRTDNFLRLCCRMAEVIPETIEFGEELGVCFDKDVKAKIIKRMEENQLQVLKKLIRFA